MKYGPVSCLRVSKKRPAAETRGPSRFSGEVELAVQKEMELNGAELAEAIEGKAVAAFEANYNWLSPEVPELDW